MGFRRLLCAVIVCAAAGGVLSGRALAATLPLPSCSTAGQPNTLVTPHFTVWYNSDPSASFYITETQAGDIGGYAEQAYAAYAAMGFPAPVTSGISGRIDINVIDLSPWNRSSVVCTNGAFDFDPLYAATVDKNTLAIGAGVFSEIEYALFVPTTSGLWLTAAAAQWASAKAFYYPVASYPPASAADIGPPDMALDCWDPLYSTGFNKCADETLEYENIGLSRWPFYEYLAQRFGTLFIDEVLTDANAAASSYTGLSNALVAHGTTFPDVFNDWTTVDLTGGYSTSTLQHRVPVSYTKVATGKTAATVANNLRVAVNHLSTRYVEFDRGDGTTTGACYTATLSLSVTIPAGTLSKPTFYWTAAGSSPVALSINGSTASASIPWDTCTWSGTVGLLSLPNASSNPDVNSANFYVTASMSVDLTKQVNQLPPPDLVSVNTPVVSVPSTDVAPLISVFGPELVKLSATTRQIRLIVQSNGSGTLQASLGAVSLGSSTLRPGNNDVRYTVPKSVVSALRRSAATSNVLTLTPVSTSGVSGTAVTRKVSIAPAATKAVKPKAKPKATQKKHK